VTRTFRDGHTETWWAADATLGWWGPDGLTRLVVATADPGTLPDKATWHLATSLPRPGGPREAASPHPAADLAEIVRIYGIRHWTRGRTPDLTGPARRLPQPPGGSAPGRGPVAPDPSCRTGPIAQAAGVVGWFQRDLLQAGVDQQRGARIGRWPAIRAAGTNTPAR
jgi:hypothetical protein